MRIHKKALHYRWLKRIGIIREEWDWVRDAEGVRHRMVVNGPKSLCAYFWLVVLTSVAPVATVLIALILIALHWQAALGLLLFLLALAVAVAFVVGIVAGIIWTTRRSGGGKVIVVGVTAVGEAALTGGSILIEFVKARKRQLCPLLEFTD